MVNREIAIIVTITARMIMVPVTFSHVQGIPTKLQAPPLPPVVVKSSSKHYLIGSPDDVNIKCDRKSREYDRIKYDRSFWFVNSNHTSCGNKPNHLFIHSPRWGWFSFNSTQFHALAMSRVLFQQLKHTLPSTDFVACPANSFPCCVSDVII